MDLSASTIDLLNFPACAFTSPDLIINDLNGGLEAQSDPYVVSMDRHPDLNPSPNHAWRIDGSANYGTKLFTLPLFAIGRPPLRIDTLLPDPADYPPYLRDILQPRSAALAKDQNIATLPLAQHALHALEYWSQKQPAFEDSYNAMPFGSCIVVENMALDISDMSIHMVPNYDLEREMLSVKALGLLWSSDGIADRDMPAMIPFENLHLESQLHDSVSLVRIAGEEDESQLFVFKSATSELRYHYHELKLLLSMPTHPNIVSKPLYIVTKRCRFGGKKGVCGFVLPFYRTGTLRNHLSRSPDLNAGETSPTREEQFRWAREITSALIHIADSPIQFYSDLRPENIIISSNNDRNSKDGSKHALLIDFENRGNWLTWSPPELYYVKYLEYLAEPCSTVPASVTAKYKSLAQDHLTNSNRRGQYQNPPFGYSMPWLRLSRQEQQSAMVFMLGKLLWCIFENVPSILNNATIDIPCIDKENSPVMFPEFRRTPARGRDLITRCTTGAPEWRGRYPPIVRVGEKIYPRGRTGLDGEATGSARETFDKAAEWWREEIGEMERWLERRSADGEVEDKEGLIVRYLHGRPSLRDVLVAVEEIEKPV